MCFRIEAKSYLFCILYFIFLCTTVAADRTGVCPPIEITKPCVCNLFCESNCISSIKCENITNNEVLSRFCDETSDYQYERFSLKYSSIPYIPDAIFDLRGLNGLSVESSSMVTLFDKTPTKASRIKDFYLEKVKIIRGFQWKMISGFKELNSLSLVDMHVPRIDHSFVEHIPKSLVAILVFKGSTTSIHDEAFASLTNLRAVYFDEGKIQELKRSMFPKPSILNGFCFKNHRLSSLPEDMFSEMPDLEYLDLTRNFLKEMPENIFGPVFSNLKEFYFTGNPLKCRCSIRWITAVERKKEAVFKGSCQEPKNLHGRSIRDLVPEDFSHCATVGDKSVGLTGQR